MKKTYGHNNIPCHALPCMYYLALLCHMPSYINYTLHLTILYTIKPHDACIAFEYYLNNYSCSLLVPCRSTIYSAWI